ncbi:hypothetical protein FI667_g3458, partial [Globisporangium splendens]
MARAKRQGIREGNEFDNLGTRGIAQYHVLGHEKRTLKLRIGVIANLNNHSTSNCAWTSYAIRQSAPSTTNYHLSLHSTVADRCASPLPRRMTWNALDVLGLRRLHLLLRLAVNNTQLSRTYASQSVTLNFCFEDAVDICTLSVEATMGLDELQPGNTKRAKSPRKEKRQQEDPVASEPKKERRIKHVQGDKQKKSDAKLLVAFTKLFLEDGFALDSKAQNYRGLVLELGSKAESSVLEFLRARGISSKGSNAVLKHLRVLHRSGPLNDKIAHHRKLLAAGKISDPAPGFTQDILEVVVFSQQSDSGYRSLSFRVNQCLAPHKYWLGCVALRTSLIVHISHFAASCDNNNKMKPPTKNNISSMAEFKGLCVMYANSAGVRIRDQALRHLRTTLNAASSHSNDLRVALYVIFFSLAKRGTRMIELEHLREWIAPPADATDANDGAEWTAEGSLAGEQLHSVRKVLGCVSEGKKTYYLVDWAPTYEPRESIPQSLIIQFNKERRALARRTYIEYEASEDNSETPQ